MCDGCLREVAGLKVAGCVSQRLCVTERTTLNAQPATFFVQQNLKRVMVMAAIEIAPRIVVDEKVCFGKPVIKGTRVPVYIVLAKLAGGMTMEQVAEEYGITLEDIRAALAYAASIIANETILPVPAGEQK
jgi:uncharacterized protein (DUF433 family)